MALRSRWLGRVLERLLGLALYGGRPTPAAPFDPDAVRRILVVRNDNLGDLLCTTPALRALRLRYPRAHLAILVPTHCRLLLEGNPDVDEVVTYTKAKHREGGTTLGAWHDMLRMFRRLWAGGFDLAITMRQRFSPSAGWLVYASRARWRLGNRPPASEPLGFFLNLGEAQPAIPEARHEVDACLGILRPLGVPTVPRELSLRVPAEAQARMAARLREAGVIRPAALVHLSSRQPANRWPLERFAAVAEVLQSRYALQVLVNWAPGDAGNRLFPGDDPRSAEIRRLFPPPALLWETPGLEELLATIGSADLVLSADGGVVHMAAALRVPQVVIFGRGTPELWGPCSPVARSLWKGPEAARVSVEDVLAAIEDLAGQLGWRPAAVGASAPPGLGQG
ncbi:MAG: glycosyltransferase family 9 protein [Candidatus Methylomirabilales bacterium]